jgi:hypothetical protein
MRTSPEFRKLESRIKELKKRFLPRRVSATGSYSAAELDGARAFRVFAHTALEVYFEDRAFAIATKALSKFIADNTPSGPLTALIANRAGESKGLPKKLATNISVLSIAQNAYGQYKHIINNNHGVKIDCLLPMLLPIGIVESEIDSTWIATIDGFGAKRGQTAHAATVTYSIDPVDDINTVNLILAGTRDIDEMLTLLMRSIK